MAVDSSFDYDRLLSLDQAKLVGRERLNSLGSYELTLNYNKISSATKEDCLEYLEANRLSVTNPTFSNKTYEGIWKCVSIAYDENKSIIQQIFKVDSSVGDLGDWDGEGAEPTWANQEGDISHISSGMKTEKAYYWKVTNPEDVNLPTTAIAGEVWTKTANDNGDETYDVVVSKQVAESQSGDGRGQVGGEAGTGGTTSIYVSGLIEDTGGNQEYALYTEFVCLAHDTPPTGLDEAAFYDTGTTNAGLPVYKDTASLWELWSDGTYHYITSTSDTVGTVPTNYYMSDEFYDGYVGYGTYAGKESTIRSTLDLTTYTQIGAPKHAIWAGVEDPNFTIWTDSAAWYLKEGSTTIAVRGYKGLNSDSWYESKHSTNYNLVVQIGKNPPAYNETSVVYNNSAELKFVSDGGTIVDPVAGEEITISNSPLDNGRFSSRVTTRTVARQRVPALFDSVIFASNGNPDESAFIASSNSTFEEMQIDLNFLKLQKTDLINSVSISVNKFGLYDYTIRSKEKW